MFLKTIPVISLAAAGFAAGVPLKRDALKPAVPPIVTITARDYAYDPIPDINSGVVDLRLHNLGKDIHHAALYRLSGGKTAADFVAALKNPGPPPVWAVPVPGPNAPAPGMTSNSIAELLPGNYVILCFVDTNGGVPHFMKGMHRAFRVVPSTNKAPAPKANMGVTLFEYGFKFAPTLRAGPHIFRVTNSGKQPHEIEIVQLLPGKTAAELHSWLLGPMTSKAPGIPLGGVMNVLPDAHPEFRMTLNPGHYVAFCFIPDAGDGKPHFVHGMEYAFEVK